MIVNFNNIKYKFIFELNYLPDSHIYILRSFIISLSSNISLCVPIIFIFKTLDMITSNTLIIFLK